MPSSVAGGAGSRGGLLHLKEDLLQLAAAVDLQLPGKLDGARPEGARHGSRAGGRTQCVGGRVWVCAARRERSPGAGRTSVSPTSSSPNPPPISLQPRSNNYSTITFRPKIHNGQNIKIEISKYSNLEVGLYIGGTNITDDFNSIKKSNLIIGTIGRINHLFQKNRHKSPHG